MRTHGKTTRAFARVRWTVLHAAVVATALLGARAHAGTEQEEAARREAAAAKALAAGNVDAARHELLSALAVTPERLETWGELARLDEKDAESQALWLVTAAAASADLTSAKLKLTKNWGKCADADVQLATKLGSLRSAAVKATQAAIAKSNGSSDAAALRFLENLVTTLDDGAPGLSVGRDDVIAKAHSKVAPDKKAVLVALDKLMTSALAKGDLATAITAARIVRGMAQQDGQTKTTPALPSDAARRALDVIAKVREELKKKEAPTAGAAEGDAPTPPERKVWTLEELGAVSDSDVPAWNAAHATWAEPGVAMSPKGLYRVETTCGLRTLVTTALVIDAQHERLVTWFGVDPTKGRTGLVRVCPDDADFEGEGAPFWWAAGFQGGDLTTLIAKFPTSAGLAGTLVHELTHRFDFAAYNGLPAWLAEGRATFTEAGSLTPYTGAVDERVTNWGMLWEAGSKGYGREEGLEKLLKGTIDDYRHNYPAGYSLWLFLVRFQGFDAAQAGARPYASKVPAYVESFRKTPKQEPVARFLQHFCDDKEGRAKDLATFCNAFGRYVGEGGSGAEPPAPWKHTWDVRAEAAWAESQRGGYDLSRIFDAPTWTTERERHDAPAAGENQAFLAAELLAAQGMKNPSLEAFRWALMVDDAVPARWLRAADAESAGGDAAAAWHARAIAHRLSGGAVAPPKGPPTGGALSAWNAARDLAEAYNQAATTAGAAARPRLSRALRAEAERVAEWIALPLAPEPNAPAAPAPGTEAAAKGGGPRAPELLPARSVLSGGLVEERWSPGDTEPGAWHKPEPTVLELGRTAEGAAQSDAIRDAGERHIFVRGKQWYSGTYSVHTRIRFLSSFASARLVVGRTDRDRGVEVGLSGGDWEYAVGKSNDSVPLRELGVWLSEQRNWSRALIPLSSNVHFEQPKQIFDVEVRVCGPLIRVFVNGDERISHRTVTDTPIEGHVGFCLQRGIVRFEEPTVRRHRVIGPDRRSPEETFDAPLSLTRTTSFSWSSAVGRRVEGLPTSKAGTILLWYPESCGVIDYDVDQARNVVNFLRVGLTGLPTAIVAAVPFSTYADAASDMVAAGTGLGLTDPGVVTHQGSDAIVAAVQEFNRPREEGAVYVQLPPPPVWIAMDANGIIRGAGPAGNINRAGELMHALAGR